MSDKKNLQSGENSAPSVLKIFTRDEYVSSAPRIAMLAPVNAKRNQGATVHSCQAYRSGELPMYVTHKSHRGNKTDEQIEKAREKARCKRQARFLFVNDDNSVSYLCTSHIYTDVLDSLYWEEQFVQQSYSSSRILNWYQQWKKRIV
ncbi:hypothetical protein PP301_gp074 [Gordonia phage GMA2]|uniref:Uncharacterized protein n=1 Tax=Gordonia phage GMA2 TaxID=1647283 RepID=A0A0K0N7B7_9CAUD|nr:hypothetical protein PP301_gp074 [Gordonia phage GMA2]AKJ72648.1 hypothetical protein GMA2_110 [Gordonia phage GMA2]